MTAPLPERVLGKSKFSMYLRTKCDRELYLSLFSNKPSALQAAGIPVPLKSRPGVQLITKSGQQFEYEQYDILIGAIPDNVLHKSNGRAPLELPPALKAVHGRTFILQPAIEPEAFRDSALTSLGVAASDMAHIPPLQGLRPDVLYVGEPGTVEYEVLPDGTRKRVASGDQRRPLSIIDLKNITEANASYSAEVCLYAFFIAHWLDLQPPEIKSQFFVSDRVFLWRHVEMPEFTKVMSSVLGGDHAERATALLRDLDSGLVNYLVYMPSVRKFFVEDVPRVVKTGDKQGWQAVEYHVNPRCGSCDWLGNKSWLSSDDKLVFAANPNHYCSHAAEADDHLSKMPTLSIGASKVLHLGGHPKVADLVGIAPGATSLKRHTLLKKDRNQIGARAESIVTNGITVDSVAKVGGLARSWNAEYDLVVNFDAGAGLLTGIALRGVLSAPFGQSFADAGQPPKRFKFLGDEAFVVPKDNQAAEWSALQGFIDKLAEWVSDSEHTFKDNAWGDVHTQVCIWEPRQYEELCNAFGRHLLRILDLPEKSQRALAWVFPSEKLMERESAIWPGIVFIRDIIAASVMLPQRFATTLLGTAEHYHHLALPPRSVDNYYREPLGNGIPRERIFDVWKSPTGTVMLFGKTVSIAKAIDRYGSVLRAHAWALGSVTARLRADLKSALSGKAPVLKMSIPSGMSGVAHDSKLWNQWSEVSHAADETVARLGLITRAEWLEASYKAVILNSVLKDHGNHRYTFEVNEGSTEAKIEEGDSYCAVGIVSWPGFPLERASSLGLTVDASAYGYHFPMHSLLVARVERFDRAGRTAIVSLRPKSPKAQDVFDALMAANIVPLGKEPIYLLDGLPYDDTQIVSTILKAIGNPICATTARESRDAMGKSALKKIPAGTGANTPIARVLWDAKSLSNSRVRSPAEAKAVAAFAETANEHQLNGSQTAAVAASAAAQLSIIWGPPGTGKTDTLAALLHSVIREGVQRKILITGPNYRTVEELATRLARNLNGDAGAACDFYWLYSRARDPKIPPTMASHVDLRTVKIDGPGMADMITSFADASRTTIVSTTAHIVNQLLERVGSSGAPIDEVFDLVVLDESSQVPVTLGLRPLCGLKTSGQLVVAGDHLQMPPINSLDPPVGAEYLVSSIQTYLIHRFSIPRQELLVNYRSNQDLVDYAKTLGYPPKLVAFTAQKQLQLLAPLDTAVASLPGGVPKTGAYEMLLDPANRVAALIHDDPVSSQANEVEAALVAGLVYCIRHSMARELDTGNGGTKTAFDDDSLFDFGVGIVTPHKAQKALVIRALLKLFPAAVPEKVYDAVDTVERFQGGERQTIIVSFGVGDTDIIEGEEAFLLQMERTNVAVSRAMAKCIVLMPKALAYHVPDDQKAAEASVAIKSYIEEFCRHRKATEIEFDGSIRQAEVRWH